MIENSVVLVLGAGASKPYGFLLGRELLEKAAADRGLSRTLDWIADPLLKEVKQFQDELRKSRSPSIDAFLETRRKFEYIGKAAIAYYLVHQEHEANLFRPDIDGDWYRYLFDMMLSGGFDSFGNNRLSIITYNYDRSLEFALLHALQSRYGKPLDQCVEKLRRIPIVHIHGELGGLPELECEGPRRPYTNKTEPRYLRVAMNGIRVVHEATPDDERFEKAQKALEDADYVIFLGFGYLAANIGRLQLDVHCKSSTVFCGTGVGITESEAKQVLSLFPSRGDWPRITIDLHSQNVWAYMKNNLDLFT